MRTILSFFLLVMPMTGMLAANPNVVNWAPSDYGAANKNWAVAQDPVGTIYVGNDQGLLEFDGLKWNLYQPPGATIVRSVAAVSHDVIFTGGFEEFGRWDRAESGELKYTSLVPPQPGERFPDSDFWRIYASGERVLFQSFHEIYSYDYTATHYLPEWSERNILFILQAGNEFWIQEMGGGIFRITEEGFEPIVGSEQFRTTTVQFLLPDTVPEAWIVGTGDKGLWRYEGGKFTPWCASLSEKLRRSELNRGLLTSRDTYIFGTLLDGIYETDRSGRVLNHLSTENRLNNNSVMAMLEDKRRNVWVATERGLSCLSFDEGIDFHTYDNWLPGSIYDACRWQGRLLLATIQGVVTIDEKLLASGQARPADFRPLTGVNGQIWSFSKIDGRLYVCHNRALSEIRPDFSVATVSNMGGYRLKQVTLGDRQRTFYGSYYKLRELDSEGMHALDGLDESIFDIETDYMQNLWLKHPMKGVYRCRMDREGRQIASCKAYGGDSGDGLPYNLQQFKAGGRVAFVGDDHFFRYNEYTDLFEADSTLNAAFGAVKGVRRIVPIDDQRFWALTLDGVWLLHYDGNRNATLEPCAGIPVDNLIYGYEQVAALDDSKSLFCGDNGFEIVSVNALVTSLPQPSAPLIESVSSAGRRDNTTWYTITEPVKVSFAQNSVTLYYHSSEGMIPGMRFRHRLQGIADEWSEPDRLGRTHYARLPQGRYTFEVALCDSFGRWSQPTAFQFEILTPWYLSGWAFTLYLVGVLVFGYVAWLLVMRLYRKRYLRQIRLEEIVSLRRANRELRQSIEQAKAEIMTQSSALLGRDEMIMHLRNLVDDHYQKQGGSTTARLQQRVNAYVSSRLDTESDWSQFLIRFEQKHADFFRTMKQRFPDLTTNDLRLSACLKMNLSTKEIAALMNLSFRTVENGRYRLRKKFGLDSNQNLNEFLFRFESDLKDEEKSSVENHIY